MLKTATLSVAAALLASAAAAPAPALAQSIELSSKDQKRLDKARENERDAMKDLEDARADLKDANEDVLEAQRRREKGSDKADDGREEFERLTANVPVFTSAKQARKWADEVDDAASRWASGASKGTDGQGDLRDAMKKQSKAQRAVDGAQADLMKARNTITRIAGPQSMGASR